MQVRQHGRRQRKGQPHRCGGVQTSYLPKQIKNPTLQQHLDNWKGYAEETTRTEMDEMATPSIRVNEHACKMDDLQVPTFLDSELIVDVPPYWLEVTRSTVWTYPAIPVSKWCIPCLDNLATYMQCKMYARESCHEADCGCPAILALPLYAGKTGLYYYTIISN